MAGWRRKPRIRFDVFFRGLLGCPGFEKSGDLFPVGLGVPRNGGFFPGVSVPNEEVFRPVYPGLLGGRPFLFSLGRVGTGRSDLGDGI